MKTLQWMPCVAVLCSLIYVQCQPEGPPVRQRRDATTTPSPNESTVASTTPSQLESVRLHSAQT